MHRLRRYRVLLALFFGLLLPAFAVAVDQDAGREIALDFRDVELTDLIQTISEMTGRNFIYDETVKGKVSLISPDRMSPDEAYEAFLSVLNVKGYTVVPSGRTNKIVPLTAARESSLPTARRSGSDQYVTRLLRLQYVDANLLASAVLAPLVPKTSSVVAYTPSNTLIMTDSAANIERLVKIVRQLDVPASIEALEIVPLKHAAAEDLADLINQLLAHTGGAPAARRGTAATAGGTENRLVIAYPRTNALIVLAAGDDLKTVRSLIARLDQPPSDERSGVNVYYLENASAEPLAETLNAILTGLRKADTPEAQAAARAAAINPKKITVTADKPTNALIINAGPEEYDLLTSIIRKLDVKRKQIFVEALILELSLDATKDLGVSLQGAVETNGTGVVIGTSNLNSGQVNLGSFLPQTDSSGRTVSSVPSVLSQAVNGIMLGGFFNPISVTGPDGKLITVPAVSALIDLSQSDGDVNILAAPRLLASDNEEAEIIIGSNVPIITQRLTDTTNPNSLNVAVERQDVALTLRFTPQITQGAGVRLNIYQEITDIASSAVGNVNEVGPTLTKRLLRNTVVADDGRTVVLGGLISTSVQEKITKVPLLGDIPLLGWLFKSRSFQERKTNLLVFITPHILRSDADLERVTQRSRQAMDQFRSREVDFTLPVEDLEREVIVAPEVPADQSQDEEVVPAATEAQPAPAETPVDVPLAEMPAAEPVANGAPATAPQAPAVAE